MNFPEIAWESHQFNELSVDHLHDLLQLRISVFVVEQNCPYPELDGKDKTATHLMGSINGQCIATARILPPGGSYAEASIGRVATHREFRRKGLGKITMELCLETIIEQYGNVSVRISAQTYLTEFYTAFGFKPTGKEYLEDGIPHLEMLLKR